MKKNNILIIMFILFMMLVLVGCNSNYVSDSYEYDDSNYKIGNMAFIDPIDKINVDWIVGDIIIQKSETEEIIIREDIDVKIKDAYKMHYYLNNGVLDIKFCGNFKKIDKSFKIKKLYIFLPTQINEINIKNTSADITIDDVSINNLNIDNISGDIDIENANVNYLNIENTSGDILVFYSTMNDVKIKSISGTIGISYNTLPQNMNIDSVSGGISVYLTNKDSATFTYQTDAGSFKTNLKYTKENNEYTFNNGEFKYQIKTVSGYFKVLKK